MRERWRRRGPRPTYEPTVVGDPHVGDRLLLDGTRCTVTAVDRLEGSPWRLSMIDEHGQPRLATVSTSGALTEVAR